MKSLLIAFCLLFMATTTFASTAYVSDTLVVTVRAQPDNKAAIVTTVQTGAPLEVLKNLDQYTKVRTKEGVEGYVRSQYITSSLPKAQQIKKLKTDNTQLQQKVDELSTLLNENNNNDESLSSVEEELALLQQEYQSLQKTSAGVLQITRERDQLQQENSDLAGRMQQLKEENSLYLRTGAIKWFFAGAGVLFFGWFLGKISRKKKRNYI